jgi:predicted Zn-dependent peptidase
MIVLRIFIVFCGFLTGQVYCKEYFDLEQTRLKNGASVISLSADWGSETEVASLLIKNGAALKFERKTSYPIVVFRLLNYRLQRLAKQYGFVVKGTFDWDYSNFLFYFPKGFLKNNASVLWDTVFDGNDVDSIELENIKSEALRVLKNGLNRKFSRMPMLSLMSHNSSLYSLGVYGNEEDLKSINEKEFSDFLKCYLNPLGTVFVITGSDKKTVQTVSKELEKKKPCFRDQRTYNEAIGSLDISVRKTSYAKAAENNSVVRIGFPAVSCTTKNSLVYDLVQQLISDDKNLSSIGSSLYVSNNCYSSGGVIEVVIGGLKEVDIDKVLEGVFKNFSILSKNLNEGSLSLSKQNFLTKYSSVINKRDELALLTARASFLYGDLSFVLKYVDKVNDINLKEVRTVLASFTEENSYIVFIRLGS